jgi:hypothetical protein
MKADRIIIGSEDAEAAGKIRDMYGLTKFGAEVVAYDPVVTTER